MPFEPDPMYPESIELCHQYINGLRRDLEDALQKALTADQVDMIRCIKWRRTLSREGLREAKDWVDVRYNRNRPPFPSSRIQATQDATQVSQLWNAVRDLQRRQSQYDPVAMNQEIRALWDRFEELNNRINSIVDNMESVGETITTIPEPYDTMEDNRQAIETVAHMSSFHEYDPEHCSLCREEEIDPARIDRI